MKALTIGILIFLLPFVTFAQYPSATGGNNDWEFIANVTFANLNNTTNGGDDDGDGDDAYDYYDDTVAYVNKGRIVTLSVTIGPDANDYLYVWIDWNRDNAFNNTNERYILASNISTPGPFTSNITIPTTASNGLTRMRVVLAWNKTPTSSGSQTYGEVEDYLVNISPYNYAYLGGWDANGLPDYLMAVGDDVNQETLDLIDAVIPESTPNLDYIDYNDYLNVTVDTGTRVWGSFVFEGAGYKNTFCMYQYPENNPPTTASDIEALTVIFPNASGTGSGLQGGGSLAQGDKVYYDSVPAGTVIAFAIVADAFSSSHTNTTINTQNNVYYSNNNLNPESVDSLKAHNVTFWDSNQEKYILGFEDINRQSGGCDHDFNDVIFYITLDPIPLFDDTLNQLPPDIEDPEGSTLPVVWAGFEGHAIENQVALRWYLASQINNDYFVVERSEDLVHFDEIEIVDGHGTTSQLIRYTSFDHNPIQGESYYRIKQVDFDGSVSYSSVISISYQNEENFMAIYPNPLNQDILSIRAEGLLGNIEYEIVNSQGVKVRQEQFEAYGNFTKTVDTQGLANGVYFVSLTDGNLRLQRKLMINR